MSNDTFPDPKIGDRVARYVRYDRDPTSHLITKVTATQVVIDNGERYTRARGTMIASTGYYSNKPDARPWTPEVDAKIEARRAESERAALQKNADFNVSNALRRLIRGNGKYERRMSAEQCALLDKLCASIEGEWTGAMLALDGEVQP